MSSSRIRSCQWGRPGVKTYLRAISKSSKGCILSSFALLCDRPFGLMSPKRTTFSGCSLSTKLRNLARLICPTGRSTTRTLAGATGESWSSILTTFGCAWVFEGGAVSRELLQLALSKSGLTHVAASEVLNVPKIVRNLARLKLKFLQRLACSVLEASQLHLYGDLFNATPLGAAVRLSARRISAPRGH